MAGKASGWIFFGVVCFALVCAHPQAQAQDQFKPAQKAISVILHDKHGKPVTAVNTADLQLQVDSQPATITQVTSEAEKPLLLGLLVDTSKRQEQVVLAGKTPEKTFLDAYLGKSGGKEFVIHFDRQIELMQDVTADSKLLNSAIDDLQPANGADADDAPSSQDGEDSAGQPRPGNDRLYDAVFLAAEDILRKPSGRKALIVVSDGVDDGSKESFASAVEAAQRSGVPVYTIYIAGEQEPRSNDRGSGGNQGGQQRRNGGIGWPGSPGGGDPGGGQTGGHSRRQAPPREDGRKILLELAQKTGGAMFEAKKKDELGSVLNDITQYLQDEYLLTFDLDPKMTGEFHRIGLTARGGSDKVQAPQAFYTGH